MILWSIIGLTMVAFVVGGCIETKKNLEYFGYGLWLARAARMAVLFLLILCVFFISRDLLTALRRRECCGNCCTSLLNSHLLFHKICGMLIALFSVLHTIGHLFGAVARISTETDFDRLN